MIAFIRVKLRYSLPLATHLTRYSSAYDPMRQARMAAQALNAASKFTHNGPVTDDEEEQNRVVDLPRHVTASMAPSSVT